MTRRDGLLIIDGIGLLACLAMLRYGPPETLAAIKDVLLVIAGAFAAGLAAAHTGEYGKAGD